MIVKYLVIKKNYFGQYFFLCEVRSFPSYALVEESKKYTVIWSDDNNIVCTKIIKRA